VIVRRVMLVSSVTVVLRITMAIQICVEELVRGVYVITILTLRHQAAVTQPLGSV